MSTPWDIRAAILEEADHDVRLVDLQRDLTARYIISFLTDEAISKETLLFSHQKLIPWVK